MANAGRALGGAASGAATGAALGTIIPGVGNIAGAIGGGLIGGLSGLFSGDDNSDEMLALQQQAMKDIQDVNVPDVDKMKIIYQQYQLAGQLTPEMEQVIAQQPSLMKSVNADPNLKSAQMGALQKLAQVGDTGMTMQGQQMLDQIRRNSDTQLHGQEQSILQNAQQRGEGGSGASLAAQLSSAQNSANNAGAQGLQVGSQLQQQALQAIMNRGTLAGQMNSQDFAQQAQKAQAQDAINRFNAANAQQVAGTNTNIANQAQAANLTNKQNIMNANTGLSNEQQKYNSQLLQQDYENRLRKAQGVYGAQQGMSNFLGQQQAASNQKFAGVMNGIAGTGLGIAAGVKGNTQSSDATDPYADYAGSGDTNAGESGYAGPGD